MYLRLLYGGQLNFNLLIIYGPIKKHKQTHTLRTFNTLLIGSVVENKNILLNWTLELNINQWIVNRLTGE